MADDFETTRETRNPGGTTVIHETRSCGSAGGWFMALLLFAALIAGVWFFTRGEQRIAARDEAVTRAADKVGAAADEAGEAARDAADRR